VVEQTTPKCVCKTGLYVIVVINHYALSSIRTCALTIVNASAVDFPRSGSPNSRGRPSAAVHSWAFPRLGPATRARNQN
jgi:hypothetical protein